MQASDNGSPPRVTTTTVNIDVSDVNDNAPVFSRGNYSLIIQVILGPSLTERTPVEISSFLASVIRLKYLPFPKTTFEKNGNSDITGVSTNTKR